MSGEILNARKCLGVGVARRERTKLFGQDKISCHSSAMGGTLGIK